MAEFSGSEPFLEEEIFAAVDDRLHHHVDFARGSLGLDNGPTLVDGRGHGHGAGDVLTGFDRGDALWTVVGDRRVDVNGVDVRIAEDVL